MNVINCLLCLLMIGVMQNGSGLIDQSLLIQIYSNYFILFQNYSNKLFYNLYLYKITYIYFINIK
jgi:hypothetical protein